MFCAAMPSMASAQNKMDVALAAQSVEPAAGKTTKLAVRFKPLQGWHGYWKNSGESGGPVSITWSAPSGVTFSDLHWPAPDLSEVGGLTSYIMPGKYDIVVDMKLAPSLKQGMSLPIKATMTWYLCSASQCTMESGEASLVLEVGAGSISPVTSDIFRAASMAQPRSLSQVSSSETENGIRVRLPIKDARAQALRLFFEDKNILPSAAQRVVKEGNDFVIEVDAPQAKGRGKLRAVVTDGQRSWSLVTTPQMTQSKTAKLATDVSSDASASNDTVAIADRADQAADKEERGITRVAIAPSAVAEGADKNLDDGKRRSGHTVAVAERTAKPSGSGSNPIVLAILAILALTISAIAWSKVEGKRAGGKAPLH